VRKLLAISLLIFVSLSLNAQFYGNSWINHSQKYFKFPIHKDGIYRIESATIANYFDINSINPKNFQLFLKGIEQFIYVKGENDNQVNSGDYIEFYANTSGIRQMDSLTYKSISYLPNPARGLFNDTIYAFLTLNNSVNNKRYTFETDTNSVLYNSENHVYAEKKFISPGGGYNPASEYTYGASDPRYTQSEGHGFGLAKGDIYTTAFSNLKPFSSTSLTCYLTLNYSGASADFSVEYDHIIKTSYLDQSLTNVVLKDSAFKQFGAVRHTFTISSSNIHNNTNFSIESVNSPSLVNVNNYSFLHYLNFLYPKTLDLNNESEHRLLIDNSVSAKGFYNFTDFNFNGSDSVLFYDNTNGKKIRVVKNGAFVRAVIPNGTGKKECFMASETNTIAVTQLRGINATGYFTNFKNQLAVKPYVIIYHAQTKSGAVDYQSYRQSLAGGAYNVISADIEELYDQFAHGIRKHAMSIQNFVRFLKDSLPTAPKYVFMIGHGVSYFDLVYYPVQQSENLIPTFGIPSNDNMLTAALSGTSVSAYAPEIPIGRISALNNTEVNQYLLKVQQHESSSPAEWKKRFLHFAGGNEESLTNTLSNYFVQYGKIICGESFGADTLVFRKNTTAPIQLNISDSIKNAISNGAAFINIFGHGSEQGFDQAIDDPLQYNNTGRYPFMMANSCNSGNIHIYGRRSVSERFVFSNQRGSIGFLASTTTGFVHALHNYCLQFYTALGKTKYNQGIGDIIKEAATQNSASGDFITKFTSLDMTLNGDPALKITNGNGPDYILKNSDVKFDITKYTDSLGINIKLLNLGSAVNYSIFIQVQRTYPNGDSAIILKKRLAPYFKDSLKFYTLIDFTRGIGLNKFKIKVDAYNDVTETREDNNATIGSVDVFIPGGDILPVYPYKYAIVPKTNTITLKASTSDPFAKQASYRFQLDTCDKFTTPLQSAFITSKGGVLEWTVNLPYKDSTVYFWRVSRDSTSPQNAFLWKESSFQTISTKRGWAQAHFNQFKSDNFQFVKYKKDLRKFVFENTTQHVRCRDGIYPWLDYELINYFFNNINMASFGCAANGWNIALFDPISGQPQSALTDFIPGPEQGLNYNCYCVDGQVLHYYSYGNLNTCGLPRWKSDMLKFLEKIPANTYVLAYTTVFDVAVAGGKGSDVESYSEELYQAFESIGSSNIRNAKDTVPIIIFGKKGMTAGQGHEVIGAHRKSVINLEDSIKTQWSNGYIATEVIGPSFKWNSLHWRVAAMTPTETAGDQTYLKVVGIKKNGQIDTLATFPIDSTDVLDLGNYANAATYPYLKLVAYMSDYVFTTSPQLKKWQVLYDEAPECAINPLKGFANINDTLQEGDVVTFRFPIENVGVKDFPDSVVVTYWVEDNSRNKVLLPQKLKPRPFVAGQVIIDTVKINSYQLVGSNALWIYVNPYDNGKYQIEQHQFNNIGRFSFKVSKDITNPLLDVTFDGIRILNGDIVSAKPNILVTIKDENKFLELNDTSAFAVYLQAPNQTTPQRIFFNQGLQFTPASLPKNSCSILYNPTLAIDGKYALSVQAKDRSANRTGIQTYQIQFEVNNKPSVTNVLNYPNPFTTSTKFVFTLTGSEVPDVFTIQIMTITGKIVKEITREELGYLHIGRNITEYAWDGRDNFGDRLANGVYLYKVITKLNGEYVEKSSTAADKFFVKEFGKMVLMR